MENGSRTSFSSEGPGTPVANLMPQKLHYHPGEQVSSGLQQGLRYWRPLCNVVWHSSCTCYGSDNR